LQKVKYEETGRGLPQLKKIFGLSLDAEWISAVIMCSAWRSRFWKNLIMPSDDHFGLPAAMR
jgi:hypothetical protein